jgi:hypothetical protein
MHRRLARCPNCGHTGAVPRDVPTTAKVRCTACGERSLVRHIVGERPCRRRRPSPEAVQRATAAREIIERLGAPALDDDISGLWR